MKASHRFHNLHAPRAGILDLEMTVYHWQEQADKRVGAGIAKMKMGQ